jgi:methyltransferase (TIGR00027 family)
VTGLVVRPVTSADAERWSDLRAALWPDQPRAELAAEARAYLDGRGFMLETVLVAVHDTGGVIGFAELSLRPYAEGCATTPVAFLEGWFVVPERRGLGVGRALVAAAEAWGRERGCREFASDTTIDNTESAAAHAALGFEEVEQVRCFRKSLTSGADVRDADNLGRTDKPASRTAYRVALRRAAHQLLDRPPVLDDPVAIPILGAETAGRLRREPDAFERGPLDAYLRAFMAARARFAEEHLDAARDAGVGQYVILGAGLDTFAYRQLRLDPPLRIWEVDHAATQAWKCDVLAAAGIPVSPNVAYVPVDFERDALADALARAGFDARAGAVFAWLGVTMYLTAAAIDETFSVIAAAAGPHGGVAFDYAVERSQLTPPQQAVFDRLSARVAAAGEPWRTAFDPAALAARLRGLGFTRIEEAGPDAVNARYFADRADGLRVGGLARLMWAGR